MLLTSSLLSNHGFVHAFPTRESGDADLCEHFRTAAIVQVKQVHGGNAVEADAADGAEGDAVVGRAAATPVRADALAVGVRVADCVPLLLANPRSGDVVAVHAGWRGVVARIVPAAVEAIADGPLLAAIGPCIGACCFEVGRDVGDRIASACDGGRVVVWGAQTKVYVDLRAAVRAQLTSLGFTSARIDDVPGCTKHEEALFHSFRRDGAGSGRMLAAIATRR